MMVTITTGSSPAGGGVNIATVTYGSAYTNKPMIVFSPGNAAAAALPDDQQIYMTDNSSLSNFKIVSGSTALAALTTYIWYIHVIDGADAR